MKFVGRERGDHRLNLAGDRSAKTALRKSKLKYAVTESMKRDHEPKPTRANSQRMQIVFVARTLFVLYDDGDFAPVI